MTSIWGKDNVEVYFVRLFLCFTLVVIVTLLVSALFEHGRLVFFSREHTTLLKGFAISTVLWGHIGLAYHIYSIQWIAGIGVTLFLISSGYGLEASFNKNGLTNYWKKRVIAVIVPYWIIYLIAVVVIKSDYHLRNIMNVLLFVKANWYIPYILIIYVIYWFLKVIVLKFKLSQGVFYGLLFACFSLWFVIVSYYFIIESAPSLLARQMFAFPLGILFYDHYDKIRLFFTRRSMIMTILFLNIMILGIGMNVLINKLDFISSLPNLLNNILSLFTILPLAIVVIRFSCVFYPLFNNAGFKFMGIVSYEIYLIQYFSRDIVSSNSLSLYACLIVTLILAWGFYWFYSHLKKILMK